MPPLKQHDNLQSLILQKNNNQPNFNPLSWRQDFARLFSTQAYVFVACSGGLDSLLLAHLLHWSLPGRCTIVHATSPAVQADSSQRVIEYAAKEDWPLLTIKSAEFSDHNYLKNPLNRCYFCKSNLYAHIAASCFQLVKENLTPVICSGANLDDLQEYRPGLEAAKEYNVRHPFVELAWHKQHIRDMAHHLDLPFWDMAASPCLASRVYTGTQIDAHLLHSIYQAEQYIKQALHLAVVRCRVNKQQMLIELPDLDREKITPDFLTQFRQFMSDQAPFLKSIELFDKPYKPGRAFVAS